MYFDGWGRRSAAALHGCVVLSFLFACSANHRPPNQESKAAAAPNAETFGVPLFTGAYPVGANDVFDTTRDLTGLRASFFRVKASAKDVERFYSERLGPKSLDYRLKFGRQWVSEFYVDRKADPKLIFVMVVQEPNGAGIIIGPETGDP